MAEIAPETPFEQFKKRFVPLYRVLLILGVLAILMSLTALSSLRSVFGHFSTDPAYATSSLISALAVPALMISSLILLWHKHPVGIRLRLVGYGVSIGASIIGLFTSSATIERITKEVIDAAIRDGNGAITREFASSVTEMSFYGTLYVSIGASLLFAWLWWKAWKKQIKTDTKKSVIKHQKA